MEGPGWRLSPDLAPSVFDPVRGVVPVTPLLLRYPQEFVEGKAGLRV